jgi:hypothetical protein
MKVLAINSISSPPCQFVTQQTVIFDSDFHLLTAELCGNSTVKLMATVVGIVAVSVAFTAVEVSFSYSTVNFRLLVMDRSMHTQKPCGGGTIELNHIVNNISTTSSYMASVYLN